MGDRKRLKRIEKNLQHMMAEEKRVIDTIVQLVDHRVEARIRESTERILDHIGRALDERLPRQSEREMHRTLREIARDAVREALNKPQS